ncbi:Hypothetical protein NTJ_04725 [Nesidiocoris tenuis]|uniref:Uncharacterized protein n=1 Tax=Nesidiocoris tenuis TaxID=355587 RepID=A0ABN7AI25_9HEMI|nr:Hypothetical protein NTJ_04725 [Nesidiocoris tenuis]
MGLPYNEPDEPPQGTHITESDENKKHAGRERTERLERRIAGCRAGREGLNCRGVGSPVRFPALRQPPLKADGDGRGPRNFGSFCLSRPYVHTCRHVRFSSCPLKVRKAIIAGSALRLPFSY